LCQQPFGLLEACRSFPLVHGARADGAWLRRLLLTWVPGDWVVGLDRTRCFTFPLRFHPTTDILKGRQKKREISPLDPLVLSFAWFSFNSLRLRFLNCLVASISDPRRSCHYDSPIRRRTRDPVSRCPSLVAQPPEPPRLALEYRRDIDDASPCVPLP
jgi:hypothetical protein